MEDKENPNQGAPESLDPESHQGGVLTNAARTVGTVIGKVSSTLGLAAKPNQPARKAPSKKRAPAKKVAAKKSAAFAKKAGSKKTAPHKTKKTR